jgi:SAM-dependent methyltransferase
MTSHLETTRASYDVVAADYAELLKAELAANPFDRTMLDLFAELVLGAGGGPVADLGCGPGRVTTYLAGLGLDAFGVDLSPSMVEVARTTYPELRFEVGTMMALELEDGFLAGALAWYSAVHAPPVDLPRIFAECARVLAPGGYFLHAFKVGNDSIHLDHAYGHPLSLDVYRYPPDEVAGVLADVGFAEVARFTRAPISYEKTPQAYLLCRRTA